MTNKNKTDIFSIIPWLKRKIYDIFSFEFFKTLMEKEYNMADIIAHHIKGKDIPLFWVKSGPIDPEKTFRVILEPEQGGYFNQGRAQSFA